MNSELRKALQDHMDSLLGYSIEHDGVAQTIREIRPDAIHTWLLLSILERMESIDKSLIVLMEQKEQGS